MHLYKAGAAALTAATALLALMAAPQALAADARASVQPVGGPTPTALAFRVDPKRVGPGELIRFEARLTTTNDDEPVAGEQLLLQWKRAGSSSWQEAADGVTGQGGRVEWAQHTRYSGKFRAVFVGTAGLASATSDSRDVRVKPIVRSTLSKKWVRSSASVKLSGEVRPAYASERVSLQRRFESGWRTVARHEPGGQGRFAFRVGGTDQLGPAKYRVKLEPRDKHLSAVSRVHELTTVRLVTYRVETRGKIVVDMKSFRDRAQEIYDHRRGWSRAYVHFKRVRTGGAFSLVLSQAKYVPSFAPICDRYWSCRVGRYVIINQNRWRWGTPYFKKAGGTLSEYRAMVTNHETGHWFGLGHASCTGRGNPAPVMMQQSKGLYGCKPNPWPLPGEIARVR